MGYLVRYAYCDIFPQTVYFDQVQCFWCFFLLLNDMFLGLLLELWIVESIKLVHGSLKSWRGFPKRQNVLSAISEDQSTLCSELVDPEQVNQHPTDEDISLENNSFLYYEGTGGKPGFISFYNHSYKEGNRVPLSSTQRNEYNFLWFVGPAVLVASFIFPSLYLRKILSNIFEDSLLTGRYTFFSP